MKHGLMTVRDDDAPTTARHGGTGHGTPSAHAGDGGPQGHGGSSQESADAAPARAPGKWILHCHIPHHTLNNNVEERGGGGLTLLVEVSR